MPGKRNQKKKSHPMLEIKEFGKVIGIDVASAGGIGAISRTDKGDKLVTSTWNYLPPVANAPAFSHIIMSEFLSQVELPSDKHAWIFYEEVKPQNQTYSYVYFFLLAGLVTSILNIRSKDITIVGLTSSAWRSKLGLPNTSDKRVYRTYFKAVWGSPEGFSDDEVEASLIAMAGIECIKSGEFGKARVLYHNKT